MTFATIRTGFLRACLKIERGPAARLLALAGVGSASWLPKPLPVSCRELTCATRRQSELCGDARTSPPWPPPKSTAAGPLSIFRQALRSFASKIKFEELTLEEALEALDKAQSRGVPGARIYDYWHAQVSEKAKADELLTRNTRHFQDLTPNVAWP